MRVLLVDHDSEGLEAIARAIRGVLELDCVSSKGDAMLLLRQNTYDVLIACERCVDGSGLDLLGRTTRTTTPLKRIFAAPSDRLQLLGPRLAPFKVQRTISYPIDLEELWLAIAQVTGTNDETDGTIERVVLDERGIPSNGTTPRGPIPPRPPAPLREVRAAPAPLAVPAMAAAVARVAQPAPEPAPRAPAPARAAPQARAPAPPATPSDTGRMRAAVPPANTSDTGRMRAITPPATPSDTGRMRAPLPPAALSDTGRMRALAPAPVARPEFPVWTQESPDEDDFAAVAAQARLGVQRKAVDEVARRKKQRLITAGAVAAAVAGVLVFLIEKFYDPEARAKEQAIAAEVTRLDEQRKFTDNLMLIEIDIENAIMDNNLDVARQELAKLVEKAPEHPRREFLQASIDRAAELTKLSAQGGSRAGTAEPEKSPVRPAERNSNARVAERTPSRPAPRPVERSAATSGNSAAPRSFGAPLGEAPRQRTIPLDAPMNAEPVPASTRSAGSSFGGRTIEASDSPSGGSMTTASVAPSPSPQVNAGTAAPPVAAIPAPASPATDVVPAKIIKRVAPVAPPGISARQSGFVVVKFNIAANGRVGDVEVVESSPNGVFDDAARAAVRKWMYEPRKENGAAVESSAKARLVFEPVN